MFKRRDFLRTCAVGSAAVMAPFGWVAAGSSNAGLSKATFQLLHHHVFRCMDGKGGVIKLELSEVRDGPLMPGLEQFSLVFKEGAGAGSGHLQDGLYQLYHPETGTTLLHLASSDTETGHYVTYFSMFT